MFLNQFYKMAVISFAFALGSSVVCAEPVVDAPAPLFSGAAADGSTALAAANGAVGFMDADTTSVANQFSRVSYNGVPPTRNNVRNGAYEFYTIGHMYNDNSALSQAVVNWVLNPANVPSGKAAYWASKNELKFMRGTDIGYPAKGTPSATVTP